MDAQIKAGQVYLQQSKAGKKWRPVWLSLYHPSRSGVGRLEIQDIGGGGVGGDLGVGVRRHHQLHGDRKMKVVRLSEVTSVLRLPPHAEACPMENMSAFCVETEERSMVFAAVKDECVDWVESVCDIAFQRSNVYGSSSQLHMKDNQIYSSRNEASEFWVVVQQNDAAAHCGLQGEYWLQVGQEGLVLREAQKKSSVRGWPYRLLRRYGKDKLTLSIEAGRRCDSGPGTFTFETGQADEIFSLIENAIKQQKVSAVTAANHNQEAEKVMLANRLPHSPLPKIPDMTTMAAILENELKVEFKKSTGQSEALYADPLDCIHSVPKLEVTTAVYMDPVNILPLKPPSSPTTTESSSASHSWFHTDQPDHIYSEVYDKVCPVQNKMNLIETRGKGKICFADDEPIYTEPIKEMAGVSRKNLTKPDPFAHLYAQVCKSTPSPSSSSSKNIIYPSSSSAAFSPSLSTFPNAFSSSSSNIIPSSSASSSSVTASTTITKARDQSLSDVIYENMGVI